MNLAEHFFLQIKRFPPWFLYLLISIIYLITIVPAPGRPIPGGTFDDGLFYRLSGHLLDGHWLGPWDELTLAKGPLHSIFSAAAFKIGLPLYTYKRLFYLIASLFFVLVGMTRQPHWIRQLTFITLLCDPFLFGEGGLRNLREGTYIPIQLFAFALGLWVIDRVRMMGSFSTTTCVASLGTAFCFGLLAITREARLMLVIELGIWLGILFLLLFSRIKLGRFVFFVFLVAIVYLSPIISLRLINNFAYSAPISSNIEEGYLPKLYSKLSSVSLLEDKPIPRVAITRRSLDALSVASRNNNGTLYTIIENFDPMWKGHICKEHPETCNEYGGGTLMWGLRMSIGTLLPPKANEADFQNLAKIAAKEVDDICKKDNRFECNLKSLGYFPSLARLGFKDPFSSFLAELKPILSLVLIPSPSPQGIPNYYAYNDWPPAKFKALKLNSLGSRKITLEESFRWTKPSIIIRYVGFACKWFLLLLCGLGFVNIVQSALSKKNHKLNVVSAALFEPGTIWLLMSLLLHLLVYSLLGFTSFPGKLYVTMASPIYIILLARLLASGFLSNHR